MDKGNMFSNCGDWNPSMVWNKHRRSGMMRSMDYFVVHALQELGVGRIEALTVTNRHEAEASHGEP